MKTPINCLWETDFSNHYIRMLTDTCKNTYIRNVIPVKLEFACISVLLQYFIYMLKKWAFFWDQ